jgi:hypothetical protein
MAVPDVWDQGGTYTREQLEAFRGPLDGNGNGVGQPLPVDTSDPEPVSSCLQCGAELHRHDQKYCSSSCRSKYRRANSAPAADSEVHATPISPDPFERLAGVASWLPAGWRLEATAFSVTLSWQA